MKDARVLSRDVTQHTDKTVVLSGWVQTIRLHAKVAFIDLRDRTGITQVVFTDDLLDKAKEITTESVVTVKGKVVRRAQSFVNPSVASGSVEVQAETLSVETTASQLPIPLNDRSVNEESRLEYRYLDLRSEKMVDNIRSRHQLNQYFRNWLTEQEFVEVETPYISKSTPEGARDYLVPSRIMPGNFYALPQSPQQYKQMLMVAGIERYFQIARCFRDEDARGDRQPEFTQLDIELSFTDRNEVLDLVEELVKSAVKKLYPEKTYTFAKFPRLAYNQVTKEYHTDSPDLRHDKSNPDELAFAFIVDFPMFEWKTGSKRYAATHHPFTAPSPEWASKFEKHPKEATSLQYDLVLNGYEIAGGSIRIHSPEQLERVFSFLGHTKAEIQEKFGHLLKAFSYGVPPHGGIAIGLDRLYAVLMKEDSIRDVIAFAKAGDGRDLLMNAPSPVEQEQLKELGIEVSND